MELLASHRFPIARRTKLITHLLERQSVLAVNDVGSRWLAQELSEATWNALRNLAPDSLEYLASQERTSVSTLAPPSCHCQVHERILECCAIARPLPNNDA